MRGVMMMTCAMSKKIMFIRACLFARVSTAAAVDDDMRAMACRFSLVMRIIGRRASVSREYQ